MGHQSPKKETDKKSLWQAYRGRSNSVARLLGRKVAFPVNVRPYGEKKSFPVTGDKITRGSPSLVLHVSLSTISGKRPHSGDLANRPGRTLPELYSLRFLASDANCRTADVIRVPANQRARIGWTLPSLTQLVPSVMRVASFYSLLKVGNWLLAPCGLHVAMARAGHFVPSFFYYARR